MPQGHPAVSAGGGCSVGQLALCPMPQGPGVGVWGVSCGAGASQARNEVSEEAGLRPSLTPARRPCAARCHQAGF